MFVALLVCFMNISGDVDLLKVEMSCIVVMDGS